jgi:hypothetical protein
LHGTRPRKEPFSRCSPDREAADMLLAGDITDYGLPEKRASLPAT